MTVTYPLDALRRTSIKNEIFRVLTYKRAPHSNRPKEIVALDNLSLEIQANERVALIGPNGAGKSTTLRTMAGVYPPAKGSVTVAGTVQGLFDLATGFEPYSTGRENIRYRGLVMGLRPEEIKAREEEIVDFAELGEFIEYPINTYSSGMVVRLAFAISTYLRGDVLLIDEVFGAGDLAFQEKAQQRMKTIMASSKLMVFASHSEGLVKELCDRGVFMLDGQIHADGPVEDVYKEYVAWVRANPG